MLIVCCVIYLVIYVIVFIAVGSCNSWSYLRLPYLCYWRCTRSTSTKNGIHRRHPINTRMWKDRLSGIYCLTDPFQWFSILYLNKGYVIVSSILLNYIRQSFTLTGGYFVILLESYLLVSNSHWLLCRVEVQRTFTDQSIHRHELNSCVLC